VKAPVLLLNEKENASGILHDLLKDLERVHEPLLTEVVMYERVVPVHQIVSEMYHDLVKAQDHIGTLAQEKNQPAHHKIERDPEVLEDLMITTENENAIAIVIDQSPDRVIDLSQDLLHEREITVKIETEMIGPDHAMDDIPQIQMMVIDHLETCLDHPLELEIQFEMSDQDLEAAITLILMIDPAYREWTSVLFPESSIPS
jgi:hypothetical protein